jgi:hypothetical protein
MRMLSTVVAVAALLALGATLAADQEKTEVVVVEIQDLNLTDEQEAKIAEIMKDQQGRGQKFLASLHTIYDRLQHDPKTFSELLYPLPALRLLIFQVVLAPVVVDYGVHEEEPFVIIKGVKLLG